jgi:RNA polymerase sigma factor for flagellar operon FliA
MRVDSIGTCATRWPNCPTVLRLVLEQSFFEQRKMLDIAEELGVTESRVSQLRSEALALPRLGMHGHGHTPDPSERSTDAGTHRARPSHFPSRVSMPSADAPFSK